MGEASGFGVIEGDARIPLAQQVINDHICAAVSEHVDVLSRVEQKVKPPKCNRRASTATPLR